LKYRLTVTEMTCVFMSLASWTAGCNGSRHRPTGDQLSCY